MRRKKLSRPRCFAYAPKFNGRDLFDEAAIFGHRIKSSGVSYNGLLEEVFAAWADNTSYFEFKQRDETYQAFIIAAYRTQGQIEAVLNEDSRVRAETERMRAELQRNMGL